MDLAYLCEDKQKFVEKIVNRRREKQTGTTLKRCNIAKYYKLLIRMKNKIVIS